MGPFLFFMVRTSPRLNTLVLGDENSIVRMSPGLGGLW